MNNLKKRLNTLNQGWRRIIYTLNFGIVIFIVFMFLNDDDGFFYIEKWSEEHQAVIEVFTYKYLVGTIAYSVFWSIVYWLIIHILLWVREGFVKGK